MSDSSKGGSVTSESSRIHDEGNDLSGVRKLIVGLNDVLPEQKDSIGLDTTIPLSPQWLITKSCDGKPPTCAMDSPRTHGANSDYSNKERWRPEGSRDLDNKKKDWWRTPSDADVNVNANTNIIRRDAWKEEERDNVPVLSVRRDRWKEGADDSKRLERRNENPTITRDLDATRRVNKWSSRWGPDDKEKDLVRREKRQENEKDGDSGQYRDRQHLTLASNRNELDREADSSSSRDNRAWRPPSISLRIKAEAPLLSSTPPKYAPGFGVGRGKNENSNTGFVVGRGRANPLGSCGVVFGLGSSIGASVKSDAHQGYRYPRAKLLDVYRKMSNSLSFSNLPENFDETPELTHVEPVEPLALIAPDVEEGSILEGIGKGDIVSSGATYLAQKGTRNHEDLNKNISRGVKSEPAKEIVDVIESSDASAPFESSDLDIHSEGHSINKDALPNTLDTNELEEEEEDKEKKDKICMDEVKHEESLPFAGPDGTSSMECGSFGTADERLEICDKHVEMHFSEDPRPIRSMEHEERKEVFEEKYVSTPPEELSLYYLDPQGTIQGPFQGADIICWFELGYFGLDLPVRLVDAPEDAQFAPLGDIMPQLKIKTETPWEYDAAEHTNREEIINEASLMLKSSVVEASQEPIRHVEGDQNASRHFAESNFLDARRDNVFEAQQQSTGGIPEKVFLDNLFAMPTFSEVEIDKMELPKQSSFSQNWQNNPDVLQEVSSGYPSPRLQTPRAKFWQADMHPITSEPEMHPTLIESSSLHGLDGFHAQKLMQLEKLHLQHKRDLSLSQPILQHPHVHEQQLSLLEHLNQQKALVSPLDQLVVPDLNMNMFHHLSSPHLLASPHHQLSASHPLSRLQQSKFQGPSSEPNLDQLLRLQQQQQQQQQQRQPPHSLLEQLLMSQQQYPLADPLAVPHVMQDMTRADMHMHHLEQHHQRHPEDALLELLLQRQHEEELLQTQVLLQRQREGELLQAHQVLLQRQHEEEILLQAQQRAHLLQQQQLKLDEQRVSGVWEVDEFGQFVPTQASIPMHSTHEPIQQQMHMLQRKPTFSHGHHPRAQNMQAELLGMHNTDFTQLQHSKALDMQMLMDLQQAERDLSTLMLGGASRVNVDTLAVLQGQRTRFDGHNNMPSQTLMAYEAELLNRSQGFRNTAMESSEGSIGRGCRPQAVESGSVETHEREARVNQNIRQRMLSGAAWKQDSALMRDYMIDAQGFSIDSEYLRQHSSDNQGNMFKIPQLQEINPDHRTQHSGDNQSNISMMLQHQEMNPEYLRQNSADNHGNIIRILQEQQDKGTLHLSNGDLQRILGSALPLDHSRVGNSIFMNEESSVSNSTISPHQPNPNPQSTWAGLIPSNIMATDLMQPETNWPGDDAAIHIEETTTVSLSAEIPEKNVFSWIETDCTVQEEVPLVASTFDVQKNPMQNSSILSSLSGNNSLYRKNENEDVSGSMSQVFHISHTITDDTSDVIETKDVKKNKKKGAKGKVGRMVVAESSPAPSSPGKSSELTEAVEEFPFVITPPSPSFGDFLPIKYESATAPPSPAWALDPHKLLKTTKSLKDVQNLEKKTSDELDQNPRSIEPMQFASKTISDPLLVNTSAASAWRKPLLSPALQSASQSKSQGVSQATLNPNIGVLDNDADLFWDYTVMGKSTQPSRVDQNNMANKGQTSAACGQQTMSIAEAKAFRQWCEEQIKRFSGKGHMSLLEFCMALPSVAEAGDYLTMYLGDGTLVESFKAEFLRRKELISAEVARVVFPTSESVIMGSFDGERREDPVSRKAPEAEDNHFEVVRSGKRRGKKGKKVVDPSLVLGFNVSSSNRILMGEIQRIDD